MKTRVIVAVVVMIHCVAVGTLLMQGCRSTGGQSMAPERTDITAPVDETTPVLAEEVPVVETPVTEVEPVIPKIETTSYVIRKGDTLSAIAKHYGVRVGDIMALNGLDNANKLRVGQKIELPGSHDVSSLPPVVHSAPKHAKAKKSEHVASASADGSTYVIKKGDSLSTIAQSLGCSVKALKEANHMSSDKITAGKKLAIPGASASPAAGMTDMTAAAPASSDASGMVAPATSDLTNSTLEKPSEIDTTDLDAEGATAIQPVDASAPAATTPAAPVDQAAVTTTADAAPVAPMAPSDYKTHTVSAGEDLSTIAIQWGVTEDSIRTLNGLGSEPLTVGQVLKILPAH
jgi:LysM repeat protein